MTHVPKDLDYSTSRCLKITEKVSFNILRLQFKWTKVHFLNIPKTANLESFRKPKASSQTVLSDRLILIGKKLVEIAKIKKNRMRHFE